ncbi:MAG: hypothetical protein M3O15_01660 [Acidobacteriota bacterium]|nr:hypothetical protein [Acidobacteriota bacterium]
MATMIQIRNVPDEVHHQLKAPAALAGMSLSNYLRRELTRILERPSREGLLVRLRGRRSVEPVESIATAVAAERQDR